MRTTTESDKKSKFKKLKENIFQILYPSNFTCIFCGKELNQITDYNTCDDCLNKLPYLKNLQVCAKCGNPIKSLAEICERCFQKIPYFKFARAPFEFDAEISKAIQAFKYNNAKYLFKPLSAFMADVYCEFNYNCDFIVPTPLSKQKLNERGYNQSLLLAECLSQRINIPVKKDLVVKIRSTLSQTMLKGIERKINLEHAFELTNRKEIKGKKILIVDDVMTTGSTINTISKLLMEYGAKEVKVLTVARTNLYRERHKNSTKLRIFDYIFDKFYKIELKYKTTKLKCKLAKNLKKKIKVIKQKYEENF